ncbi:peptidase M20 [Pseudoxanthomonas kalamensis DSM 18571]|uniref:M28 family metallopeptidase n=1 Tax=Pseudoxanthomonas kalamensis TaxID=289483 RepID=UPI0013919BA9|nr:M28 family metallopeptidase [Pseudoxanthomonas kalamensis]KAF1712676.1 peptidase M20 [Pseudoxanthomonas kalamensis DSM 18571]
MKSLVSSLSLLLALGCASCSQVGTDVTTDTGPTVVPGGDIQADNLAESLRMLTSDAFEGRAPNTPGEEKTVDYIAERFAEAGLEPAGDDGGWFQQVTLERSQIDGPVTASFITAAGTRELVQGEDIAVETLYPRDHVDLQDVPLVFVGYGIVAPELQWDDYAGVDVKDKIVVILVNDPDFESGEGDFGGKAMTYYGRWTYKYEEAARRGAAGALIVHETAPAAYPWATVRNGRNGPQYDIVRADAAQYHLPMRGWMQREVAERLFRESGLDFDAEKAKAQQRGFSSYALEGASATVAFDVKREQIVSRNVAGVLPGATQPQQTVILSGHWDSFGVIADADESGDAIVNGAVDNATSIASLIEMARVFATGPRPARSLLFLAVTAEESGLLGAKYYAAHPLRPLETTIADLNIEMWSPDGPTRDISSWGVGKVSLERDLIDVARSEGRSYSPDENLEAGLFYRADHFAFAQAGVPAITIGPGMDQIDGGVAGGKAARAEYFANCYHQPCDEFDDSWDMRGPVEDTRTVYRLAERLANGSDWPQWDAGSEFRAEREKTAAARE